jgi:hypothetical protein
MTVTSLVVGEIDIRCLLMLYAEEPDIISLVHLSAVHDLNVISRKHHTHSNSGTVRKIPNLYYSKKDQRTIPNEKKTKYPWQLKTIHGLRFSSAIKHVLGTICEM